MINLKKKITIKEVIDGKNILREQNDNIYDKYYYIIQNSINQALDNTINKNQLIQNIPNLFTTIPNLVNDFSRFNHFVLTKNDNSKSVVVLQDFENTVNINNILENLEKNRNILIVVLSKGELYSQDKGNYKGGISGRKNIKVPNFQIFKISTIRDLSKPLEEIYKHFN